MTTTETIAHPDMVTRDEWLAERKALLAKEKAHTREGDAVSAERRRLPMVQLDKEYRFEGPDGEASLLDLFGGRRQLIVYHFMFDPEWEEGCPGCTGYVDALGDLSMLAPAASARGRTGGVGRSGQREGCPSAPRTSFSYRRQGTGSVPPPISAG
jgi:predicted dithiol-disulfide oxidoreductase (DUF899 family)